jgi:3-methyl-2-oxobutanoate hydroxymethyltransferase
MSHQVIVKRNTLRTIRKMKGRQKIVCMTAYTKPIATIADRYADLVLVGDSLGMVLYGMDSTVPVDLDMMIRHGSCVYEATNRSLVVVDMPFGSYQKSPEQAFDNASEIMKRTGAGAVKLEGGSEMAATIEFLVSRGIAVMGHTGLQPQSVNALGGYRSLGKDECEQKKIYNDAIAVSEAGAFSVVLECVKPSLAREITSKIPVPTIGIGASEACDGQILVTEDFLGLTGNTPPKFVKKYANLMPQIEMGISEYASEVRSGQFPLTDERDEQETDTGSIRAIH